MGNTRFWDGASSATRGTGKPVKKVRDLDAERRIKRNAEPNRTFPPQYAKTKGLAYQKMCRRGEFR